MDQCMIDITDIQGSCRIGKRWFSGKTGSEEIAIEEIAQLACGFINYEYMVTVAEGSQDLQKEESSKIVNGLLSLKRTNYTRKSRGCTSRGDES